MNDVTTTNRNQCVPPIRAGDAQAIQMIPNTSCTSFKIPGMDWKYWMLNFIQFRLLSGLAWPCWVALGGAACDWSTVTTVSVIIVGFGSTRLFDYTYRKLSLPATSKLHSATSVTLLHRTTLKTKRESCDLSRCLSSHPKHFPMHTPLLLLRSSAPRRSSACIGWDLFLKRSFLNTYAPFVTDREEFCHVSVGHTDIPLSQTPFTAIKMQTRRFLIALIKYAFSPGTLFPYTEITSFHPPNNKQVCCAAWSWLPIV